MPGAAGSVGSFGVAGPPGGRAAVDVGVVCWNTRDLTVAGLRRLLDVDQGCDVRLLVRDNGSSDGSAARIARDVPEAELEVGTENLGFAAGMNRLLLRSRSPWFFALNADAWPMPGALAGLVATATAHPRAAVVAPRLERPDRTLEESTHPFPSVRVAALGAVGRLDRDGGSSSASPDAARAVDWAVGAALLMRRAALEAVGGFDESFFMYVEDLEWCWRARHAGWEVWFDPSAVVCHVGNVSGRLGYGPRRAAVEAANVLRFYRAAHGPADALAWRALGVAGAARLWASARWRGDRDQAEHWWHQLRGLVRPDREPGRPPQGPPAGAAM